MTTTVTFPPIQDWSLRVYLGGADVSARLTGTGHIEAEESISTIAAFSLRWNTNPEALVTVDLAGFINSDVTIEGRANPSDEWTRLFTGKVDYVEYDRHLRVITYTCSDKLKQKTYDLGIESPASVVAVVPGSIPSEDAFDAYVDGFSLFEDLLETVRADVSLDAFGAFRSVPWQAKADADYFFGADAIESESVAIDLMDANELITKLVLTLEYSFPRLYQHVIQYAWEAFVSTGANETTGLYSYLRHPYGLPTRDQWDSAISGTGWARSSAIGVKALPLNGMYNGVGYQGDAAARAAYFSYVGFRLMRRWAQTRKIAFVLTIEAPTESAKYGVISEEESASASYEYDTEGWVSSRDTLTPSLTVNDPDNPWDGFTVNGAIVDDVGTYHRDNYGIETFAAFAGAVLARALRRMHNALRQNFVTFSTAFCPWANTTLTVELDAEEVHTKGKVYQIRHEWSISQESLRTSVRLAICLGGGGEAATSPEISVPDYEYAPLRTSYAILNKIGGVPGTPPLPEGLTNVWLNNYADVLVPSDKEEEEPPPEEGEEPPEEETPEEEGDPEVDQGDVGVRVMPVETDNPNLYPVELRMRPDEIPAALTEASEETVEIAHSVSFPADLFVVKA